MFLEVKVTEQEGKQVIEIVEHVENVKSVAQFFTLQTSPLIYDPNAKVSGREITLSPSARPIPEGIVALGYYSEYPVNHPFVKEFMALKPDKETVYTSCASAVVEVSFKSMEEFLEFGERVHDRIVSIVMSSGTAVDPQKYPRMAAKIRILSEITAKLKATETPHLRLVNTPTWIMKVDIPICSEEKTGHILGNEVMIISEGVTEKPVLKIVGNVDVNQFITQAFPTIYSTYLYWAYAQMQQSKGESEEKE